jgi:hypothetical protein
MQFSGYWLWDLFKLFSTCELPFWEFKLIKVFHDPMPMEQRTKICSVVGEVW